MGRRPCCRKEEGLNKGAWSVQEDRILIQYINAHGKGKWRDLPGRAGLKRCGKSCRLRWLNYLNPNIKRGNISPDEDDLIIRLHNLLGNRWSLIAGRLPGRTDNEIKNYWNTNLSKKINALSKQQMSNSAKDHGSTGATAMEHRPHQVIRPKAVRCNKSYPIVPFHQLHDAEAKQQPALPIATSTSAAMPLVLLEETDLSKYFVDFFDQDQLHAGGADEDLLLQAWHFDMKDNASDMYEGDGTCNVFNLIQKIIRFGPMVHTNLKHVLNDKEGSHL